MNVVAQIEKKNVESTNVNNGDAFQIVSENITSTGKVYVVKKNGRIKKAIIPKTVKFNREQLERFAFPPPSLPPQQPKPELNHELLFYGIALDQKSNAVVDARAEANVLIDSPLEKSHRETVYAVSDANGEFSFKIPWGQQMMVTVTANTNFINPPPRWFQYGPVGNQPIFHPDPNNPVIFPFQIREYGTNNEPMHFFSFNKRFRAPNGIPIQFDLTTGQIVPQGGDLIILITCPEPYTEMKPFPWSAKVEVVGGGLIHIDGQNIRMGFLNEAPSAGYSKGFEIEYDSNSPFYRRQFEGWYYIRSRNGSIYSKIYFDVDTRWDQRGVPFGINAVVNLDGSPYLHEGP